MQQLEQALQNNNNSQPIGNPQQQLYKGVHATFAEPWRDRLWHQRGFGFLFLAPLSFGYFPLDCNDYPATVFLVLSLAGSLVPSFGHAGQFLSVSQAARSHQCLSAPV